MSGLNKMLVIGRLGTDPEMRYTSGGTPVTSFRLATGRTYTTRDGERREETEWFTVTSWSQLAETVNQYLTKGRRVYVEGRLKSSTWQGQDGQSRFRNEIIAEKVMFLDGAGDQQGGGGQNWQGGPPPTSPDEGGQGGPPGPDGPADGPADGPPDDDDDLPW